MWKLLSTSSLAQNYYLQVKKAILKQNYNRIFTNLNKNSISKQIISKKIKRKHEIVKIYIEFFNLTKIWDLKCKKLNV